MTTKTFEQNVTIYVVLFCISLDDFVCFQFLCFMIFLDKGSYIYKFVPSL